MVIFWLAFGLVYGVLSLWWFYCLDLFSRFVCVWLMIIRFVVCFVLCFLLIQDDFCFVVCLDTYLSWICGLLFWFAFRACLLVCLFGLLFGLFLIVALVVWLGLDTLRLFVLMSWFGGFYCWFVDYLLGNCDLNNFGFVVLICFGLLVVLCCLTLVGFGVLFDGLQICCLLSGWCFVDLDCFVACWFVMFCFAFVMFVLI